MNPIVLNINDPSQTAEARRAARSLAVRLGFDEAAAERVAIVASEATTNLLKHGGGGRLILSPLADDSTAVVEVLALDRGPGMANVPKCAGDGFSTAGTAGNGLGAIARLSAFCDIYSRPGGGTAMLARVSKNGVPKPQRIAVRGIEAAMSGEDVCGDAWAVSRASGRTTMMLADGLGHGPDAAAAARAAVTTLMANPTLTARELIEAIHLGLRHTRGAAVAVAELDESARKVTFAGLGNINGRICIADRSPCALISVNGTAGIEARMAREFAYDWPAGAAVILHSDGLTSRWDLSDYPGVLARDPSIISGVLFRDYCRGTDDASIVVAA